MVTNLPGRLGDPDITLGTDPRCLPELAEIFRDSPRRESLEAPKTDEELREAIGRADAKLNKMYDSLSYARPGDINEPEVEIERIVVDGFDGNKIPLHLFVPNTEDPGPRPALLYVHGGGMTAISTSAKPRMRWAKTLALKGILVAVVDYRNAWSATVRNPFPAGLNDCVAATKHLHSLRGDLNIKSIVLQGEGGGGNLVLATALKAKKEGWEDAFQGIFAYCPEISGEAHYWTREKKLGRLPSLVENSGYFIGPQGFKTGPRYYSPNNTENPLAWPYYASLEDMRGLPTHCLSMNEPDPSRNEGIAYWKKLKAAGIKATADVNLGVAHGCGMLLRQQLPEQYEKITDQIASFAKGFDKSGKVPGT